MQYDCNEYLASFLGATLTDEIGVIELNAIPFNSTPTRFSKQAHVKRFDCDSITLKISVNMFQRMDIAESIYKCLVEPSY